MRLIRRLDLMSRGHSGKGRSKREDAQLACRPHRRECIAQIKPNDARRCALYTRPFRHAPAQNEDDAGQCGPPPHHSAGKRLATAAERQITVVGKHVIGRGKASTKDVYVPDYARMPSINSIEGKQCRPIDDLARQSAAFH